MLAVLMGRETCHIHRARVRVRESYFIRGVLIGHIGIVGKMLGFIGRWLND